MAIQGCGNFEINTESELQEFSSKQIEVVKLANGLGKLSHAYISYIKGTLERLGLKIWAPNLVQHEGDLYNSACRMISVTTFQQLVADGAYNNYSMDCSFVMKTGIQ
ncbi:hypothetical protein O181_066239 [Austropuccinia psidii MF-1]|uniref:Uncharacterized protein n=1 Tax=Austropuccinia psidii MF-1 TaxID=1389203 RepID=A0A9Q3I5C8_9BASI|nr:hypothetical protein [Austropuccinia psidii MF-1]